MFDKSTGNLAQEKQAVDKRLNAIEGFIFSQRISDSLKVATIQEILRSAEEATEAILANLNKQIQAREVPDQPDPPPNLSFNDEVLDARLGYGQVPSDHLNNDH